MTFLSVESSLMEGLSMAIIMQFIKMKNKTTLSNHCLPIRLTAPILVLDLFKVEERRKCVFIWFRYVLVVLLGLAIERLVTTSTDNSASIK